MATLSAPGYAFTCADFPTRLLMATMADTSALLVPYTLKFTTDGVFELAYPGQSEWRIAALIENLRLFVVTIPIGDGEAAVYTTLHPWADQLRVDRDRGFCQLYDPPCQRATISGIGE